ncbi:hypothetical protein PIB30_075023, partial [Stylosanthes scabra]|nr:hypothetical protein [Stylosanthes scabra]
MAARAIGRRGARGDNQEGEPAANESVNLHNMNESWHITGALNTQRERVLLPRRCAFMMPPPVPLIPFIRQGGFEHA